MYGSKTCQVLWAERAEINRMISKRDSTIDMLELLGRKFDEEKIYFHHGLMMLEDGWRQAKAR